MDPNQAQMLKFMPLFFGFLMFSYPSGLSVYYVVNTFLSILQQWYNTRSNAVPAPPVSPPTELSDEHP
jgi:membrane protein insertase Oxa1/YidC/SpoIIIJ